METAPEETKISVCFRMFILQCNRHGFDARSFEPLGVQRDEMFDRLVEHKVVRNVGRQSEASVQAHLNQDRVPTGGEHDLGDGLHNRGRYSRHSTLHIPGGRVSP
jgi:hypothetical protein